MRGARGSATPEQQHQQGRPRCLPHRNEPRLAWQRSCPRPCSSPNRHRDTAQTTPQAARSRSSRALRPSAIVTAAAMPSTARPWPALPTAQIHLRGPGADQAGGRSWEAANRPRAPAPTCRSRDAGCADGRQQPGQYELGIGEPVTGLAGNQRQHMAEKIAGLGQFCRRIFQGCPCTDGPRRRRREFSRCASCAGMPQAASSLATRRTQ